ncbi:MAG: hypothetical protein GX803_09215 [Lentisphaerae bacterium]|jgi:hypothetical protein|nr:hypothetical protein [Lentisphaerota bacterium]
MQLIEILSVLSLEYSDNLNKMLVEYVNRSRYFRQANGILVFGIGCCAIESFSIDIDCVNRYFSAHLKPESKSMVFTGLLPITVREPIAGEINCRGRNWMGRDGCRQWDSSFSWRKSQVLPEDDHPEYFLRWISGGHKLR